LFNTKNPILLGKLFLGSEYTTGDLAVHRLFVMI